MKPRHQVSRAAIALVKSFEGYQRSSLRLPDGRWTVGYGHTLTAREGVSVSEQDAEALLIYDLMNAGNLLCDLTFTPLTQNQFDALAAFVFGIGADNFRNSNTLRLINAGDYLEAAASIEAWRKTEVAGEELVADALIRRRAAEKLLFLTPDKGFVPASAAIVAPRIDPEAAFAHPVELEIGTSGPEATVKTLGREIPPALPATPPAPEPSPPPPAAAEPARPAENAERLYTIPGYDARTQADARAPEPVSLRQLYGVGAAGLGLLAICFVAAMRASSGTGGPLPHLVAALTGLLGAVALFSAIYLILNRLDRED